MRLESEVRKALEGLKKELERSDPLDSLLNMTGLYVARYVLEWVLEERETVIDGVKAKTRELEIKLMNSGILTKIEDRT